MVAKASSSPPKSSSQIELSETFSHSEVSQVTPSSSDDFEVEAGLSRSSSKEQQEEVATLIDIVAPIDFERQQAKFSFKELARFFGPGAADLCSLCGNCSLPCWYTHDLHCNVGTVILKGVLCFRTPGTLRQTCRPAALLAMLCSGSFLSVLSW